MRTSHNGMFIWSHIVHTWNEHLMKYLYSTFAMARSRCLTSASCRLWLDRMPLMVSTSSCSVSVTTSNCWSRSSCTALSLDRSWASCFWANASQSELPMDSSRDELCRQETRGGQIPQEEQEHQEQKTAKGENTFNTWYMQTVLCRRWQEKREQQGQWKPSWC